MTVYYREMVRTDVVPSTFSRLRSSRHGKFALFLLLVSFGCGEDPILTKAREANEAAKAQKPGGAPGGSPSGAPGAGGVQSGAGRPEAPKPGVPEEPKPGIPDQPPPEGAQAAPGPGIPTPPTPGSSFSGPRVAVSGTIDFPSYKGGMVRVSAFDGPHAEHAGNQPKIVGEARLERPGPFTIEVPESAKNVYLEAAVDEDGNGRPGPLEPQGSADRYPVQVDSGPQSGIVVTLSRRAPPPGGAPKDDF